MLAPIGKRIIVTPIEENNGTIVTINSKPCKYLVYAIGDEITRIKPNDIVYLQKHAGAEIIHQKEKFIVIDESDILAKLD